jgi:large subunit ribosomal protein L4
MVTLPIFDKTGSEVGKFEIDPQAIAPNISMQLLHDAVVMYQANMRQGTHRTKTRGEVAGSTKKMYRQKGTGHARAGSKRSNIRRGGGHGLSIRPRDYSYRLPKKALRAATRMSIASKVSDDQVVVLDQLAMSEPKTGELAGILKALGQYGKTALLVVDQRDSNINKSGRNIPGITVMPLSDVNAYEVLRPDVMIVTKAAMSQIKESCERKPHTGLVAVGDSSNEELAVE